MSDSEGESGSQIAAAAPKTFKELGLADPLCDACQKMNFKAPTAIQSAAFGPLSRGSFRVPATHATPPRKREFLWRLAKGDECILFPGFAGLLPWVPSGGFRRRKGRGLCGGILHCGCYEVIACQIGVRAEALLKH